MPLPRYIDREGNKYDVSLVCSCGYAIDKDKKTQDWKICPLCFRQGKGDKPLKTKRINYGAVSNEYIQS